MNRVIAIALAALLLLPAVPTAAQSNLNASTSKALFYTRDITAAAYEYCIMAGAGGHALGKDIEVTRPIVTSGSSTTTTSKVASQAPFLGIDVNDEISVANVDGERAYREVITNADDDTITVDTAWNLGSTGVGFWWRDNVCGNAATNGIITVAGRETVTFDIQVITLNATSIDVQVEGRNQGAGTGWTPLVTASYTATGGGAIVVNRLGYQQLRLGVKVTGDAGAQSVTAKVIVQ